MRIVHATGKILYKVLYQHTMFVISLSNILIKINFKQITRIPLKFVQYCEGDYMYILYNTVRETTCIFWAWRHIIFAVHSPMSPYCVLSHIPMIWGHDKVVRQRTSSATLCHSFITTVWWYNILYQTDDFR